MQALRIVVDSNNQWLFYGEASPEAAREAAKRAGAYDPEPCLAKLTHRRTHAKK